MALPTYYISSSVTNVDTSATSKILMLPPAQTVPGVQFFIKDTAGFGLTNPIYISTQTGNTIEQTSDHITVAHNFGSYRLVPSNTTNYAITLRYDGDLNDFVNNIQVGLIFSTVNSTLSVNWSCFSMSEEGTTLLAAASGINTGTQGFYYSTDGGLNWTYFPRNGTFVDCVIGANGWYVAEQSDSVVYRTTNSGASWNFTSLSYSPIAIDCDNTGQQVLAISSVGIHVSMDQGNSFTDVFIVLAAGTSYTDVAVKGDGNAAYITSTNVMGDQIYVSTDKTKSTWTAYGPTAEWSGITANDGNTAYAVQFATGEIWKSTDTGQTWSLLAGQPYGNIKPLCSFDGNVLYGLDSVGGNTLYQTLDGGTTFTAITNLVVNWVGNYGVDATGNKILAGVSGGNVYLGTTGIL